jgi:hypothetical protein
MATSPTYSDYSDDTSPEPMGLSDCFEVEHHMPGTGTFLPDAMHLHMGSKMTLPLKPRQLGASPAEAAKWLGLKNGLFRGASKYVRGAFLTAKHAPRKPSNGGEVPASLQYGISNEKKAYDAYIKFRGYDSANCTYQPGFQVWGDESYVGAATDALINEDGLLEIKCPFSLSHDPDVDVPLKAEWVLQALIQCEAYNRSWCDVFVWHPLYHWHWRIYRDHVSYHDKYEVTSRKRSATGELAEATVTMLPRTFMEIALLELAKFSPDYDGELGSAIDIVERLNREFKAVLASCVHRLNMEGLFQLVNNSTFYRQRRVDPTVGHLEIDRWAKTADGLESGKSIFLRVHYHNNPAYGTFWSLPDYQNGTRKMNGGSIIMQYHRYVLDDAFDAIVAHGECPYKKGFLKFLAPLP